MQSQKRKFPPANRNDFMSFLKFPLVRVHSTATIAAGLVLATVLVLGVAGGCAGAPSGLPHGGAVLVRNTTDDDCEVFLKANYLRKVGPRRTVLVANLPAGRFGLRLVCSEAEVERAVEPLDPVLAQDGGLQMVSTPGDAGEVVDHTGMLVLDNPSRLDLEVELGKDKLGNALAGSRAVFSEVPVGQHELRFTDIYARGSFSVPVSVVSMEAVSLVVEPPFSRLTIANDCQESVSVGVRGEDMRMEAGSRNVLEGLPPGKLKVDVLFLDSGRTMTAHVELGPGEEQVFKLSDQAGNLIIENRLDEAIELFLADEPFATVPAGDARLVRGLAPGKASIKATVASGKTFQHSFVISPGATETWLVEAANSQLMVRNLIGEDIVLQLDGRRLMELKPLDVVRFHVNPGTHQLTAECSLTRHAQTREVEAPGGELVELAVGPQGGRLLVDNSSGTALRLFRNGRPIGTVRPGTVLELAGQPLGSNVIEALDESDRVLLRRTVEIRTRSEGGTRLAVATTSVAVRLRNYSGEPLKIDPSVQAENRIVEADGEALLHVEGVDAVLKLKGETSGNRYDQAVSGQPGEIVDLVIMPVQGGLAVENQTEDTLALFLDDEAISTLQPGESMFRDRVSPGQHVLQARLGEQVVEEVSCRIVRDSWYMWQVAPKLGTIKVNNSTAEDLRMLRDGAEAGVLPAGGETTFEDLPPVAITLSAVGIESGQVLRFSCVPGPRQVIPWMVKSASGGIKLVGFQGASAAIAVDDVQVAVYDGTAAEPLTVPVTPGTHIVKVKRGDGQMVVAAVQVAANLFATVQVAGSNPEVEIENLTEGDVDLVVDGTKVQTLASSATFTVLLADVGIHSILARSADGLREWLLKDVYLPAQGRFAWKLTE